MAHISSSPRIKDNPVAMSLTRGGRLLHSIWQDENCRKEDSFRPKSASQIGHLTLGSTDLHPDIIPESNHWSIARAIMMWRKTPGANCSDPNFGCQVSGCTPLFGSVAALPASPPTTPSNSSQAGQGVVILFPNGASITTQNIAGALKV